MHKFVFCGKVLPVVASAVHLGHVLSTSLDDSDDILRVIRDMARKANCISRSITENHICANVTRQYRHEFGTSKLCAVLRGV